MRYGKRKNGLTQTLFLIEGWMTRVTSWVNLPLGMLQTAFIGLHSDIMFLPVVVKASIQFFIPDFRCQSLKDNFRTFAFRVEFRVDFLLTNIPLCGTNDQIEINDKTRGVRAEESE